MQVIYNDKGQYRAELPGGYVTPWTPYERVLTFEYQGRRYIAFSEYWRGCGVFDMVGVHKLED